MVRGLLWGWGGTEQSQGLPCRASACALEDMLDVGAPHPPTVLPTPSPHGAQSQWHISFIQSTDLCCICSPQGQRFGPVQRL